MLFASPPLLHFLQSLGGISMPGGMLCLSCPSVVEDRGLKRFVSSY